MLASDEAGGTLDALRFSLASDIVELVVLTTDEAFLQTLREAVSGARRLWHVPSADKVSDLLLAGEVGILVLDVQTLSEAPGVFVGQIKRQFPDLVVVVAGNRDAEVSLAGLISAGSVYRFIHKPMSPGRAKLFADAAVKKYDDQRRRAAPSPAKRGARISAGLVAGCAAGALAAIVAAAWIMHGATQREPPHGAGAGAGAGANAGAGTGADAGAGAAHPPADEAAGAGLAQLRERLLARAQSALLEDRLDEAAAAIKAARKSGVEHERIAFLTAQLAKSREQLRAARAAAHVAPLLALAARRLEDSHVIDPDGDSALYYIREAMRLDPGNAATQEAEKSLATRVLAEARGAIDARDFPRAARWLEAADGVAATADIEAVKNLLADARREADTDSRAPAQ